VSKTRKALGIDHRAGGGTLLTGLRLARTSAAVTSLAANRRHVSTIAADGFSALPARYARFVRGKLVSRPLGVRRPATLTGNLTLFRRIHGRKTALARICH
jgi:hypothetical protein